VRGLTVRHPDDVEKKTGGPYTVFTPYSNSWKGLPLPHQRDIIREPDAIRTPADIDTMALPDSPRLPDDVPFRAGEAEAQRRLRAFLDGKIGAYDDRRDRVDLDGTSTLSPYLRWGMLSAREAAVSAIIAQSRASSTAARAGAATWLTELIWRDFYHMILYHFPHVRHGNFREAYDALRWENDAAAFAAWCDGRTGFPVVDAAMRQLNQSGWMHNRARMIVASFLTKDLLIDWRWGERYFMQQLIDGDVAANNGGWQWAAGTGTDAAPYFRIFNPTSQGEKHDPHGDYVRRWVPELANVPDKFIQAPHELNSAEQRRYNCVIGRDYPAPIVDHKQARLRTLDAYKAARAA
jgi:deoxyribodipyrimidine photo-lyase